MGQEQAKRDQELRDIARDLFQYDGRYVGDIATKIGISREKIELLLDLMGYSYVLTDKKGFIRINVDRNTWNNRARELSIPHTYTAPDVKLVESGPARRKRTDSEDIIHFGEIPPVKKEPKPDRPRNPLYTAKQYDELRRKSERLARRSEEQILQQIRDSGSISGDKRG